MALPFAPVSRSKAIARMQRKLLASSSPRAQMALIVALTGAFGLLSSFVLLRFGLETMALRYPLALGLAYLFFLFLIWLWLRANAEDFLDLPDVSGGVPLPSGRSASDALAPLKSGGGGDFSGGGAGGSFDAPASNAIGEETPGVFDAAGNAAGPLGDADELAIPLVAIALAVGLALASLYVVYIAPMLFAEVLVDGALSYALFRYLRGQDPEHWLASALKRTVLPFVVTALFVAGVGAAMSAYAPKARSVGEVIEHARK